MTLTFDIECFSAPVCAAVGHRLISAEYVVDHVDAQHHAAATQAPHVNTEHKTYE